MDIRIYGKCHPFPVTFRLVRGKKRRLGERIRSRAVALRAVGSRQGQVGFNGAVKLCLEFHFVNGELLYWSFYGLAETVLVFYPD